jgi:hypothetical protein
MTDAASVPVTFSLSWIVASPITVGQSTASTLLAKRSTIPMAKPEKRDATHARIICEATPD